MTGDPVLRWIRVLTLASMLFLTGLAAHVAAGGPTPITQALLPLFVLTVFVVTQFVGAAINPARIVVLLLGGQGLLHAVLSSSHGSTDMAGMAATSSSHHMLHVGVAASHDGDMSLIGGAEVVMLLAHLAAVLVVGMWLAAGERALWRLLAFTVRPVVSTWRSVIDVACRVIGATRVRDPQPQPGCAPRYSIRSSVWAATVVSRRGPPRCCIA